MNHELPQYLLRVFDLNLNSKGRFASTKTINIIITHTLLRAIEKPTGLVHGHAAASTHMRDLLVAVAAAAGVARAWSRGVQAQPVAAASVRSASIDISAGSFVIVKTCVALTSIAICRRRHIHTLSLTTSVLFASIGIHTHFSRSEREAGTAAQSRGRHSGCDVTESGRRQCQTVCRDASVWIKGNVLKGKILNCIFTSYLYIINFKWSYV